MFLGHFAVALAAKRAAPNTSLGTLTLGAQFADLLWPLLLLAGVEHARLEPGATVVSPLDFYDYPISHSLLTALLWSLVVAAVYYLVRHYRTGAWIVSLCVISHWGLDLLTHRPDLPLWPGSRVFLGLGLWNSPVWSAVAEFGLFLAGALIYVRSTKTRDRTGVIALWLFCALLAALYFASLFGPPPPSISAVAISGILGWLFVLWGYWIDRHRIATHDGALK